MKKTEEAKKILKALGLPNAQQNEMAALTLLALCNIKKNKSWKNSQRISLRLTKGIISFVNKNFQKTYAPNTRESFRKDVLHYFVQARIADINPDDPALSTNSPLTHYAISKDALDVIKTYGTNKWDKELKTFLKNIGSLTKKYNKDRKMVLISLKLSNGKELNLSPGKHNKLQVEVIKQFAARFAKNSELLYLGDTAQKDLYLDEKSMQKLGIPINQNSKLPDIVIVDRPKKWLFLIEVVTSRGTMSPKRLVELEDLLKNCKLGKIYVTAFPSSKEFKRFINDIAWETEVWISEFPDDMIHFNGDKFIKPR